MTLPDMTVSAMVRRRAAVAPDDPAYISEAGPLTWAEYDQRADQFAARLREQRPRRGDRVAVWLPDGPWQHAAYLACERAGLVTVGIPLRAGERERAHLLARTGARLLVQAGPDGQEPGLAPLGGDGPGDGEPGEPLGVDELWLINSTSGTTGLPKCVEQTQRTWLYLARHAVEAAAITADDGIMSAVPGPFGYGIWTAHVLPPLLGTPCVLRERFDAADALRAAAEHRVTVLACVTTQLRLMLASPALAGADLSALRVQYTGGERTPPEVIGEWERRTGSTVLQFYGSNEFGGFSCTALADDEDARLTSVGRVLAGTRYRLYDDGGADITVTGGPGQPGGLGPGVTGGYFDDPAADAELFHADGYQLLPDLVTVDERVGAAVTRRDPAAGALTLEDLRAFLDGRGVSKEYFPEYVVVLDEMPVSMGGKIARSAVKAAIETELRRASR
jgi:acyl-CoA synthetase